MAADSLNNCLEYKANSVSANGTSVVHALVKHKSEHLNNSGLSKEGFMLRKYRNILKILLFTAKQADDVVKRYLTETMI